MRIYLSAGEPSGDLHAAMQRLMLMLLATLTVLIVVIAVTWGGPVMAPVAIAIGVWVMLGAFAEILTRIKLGKVPAHEAWQRFKGLPRSNFGTAAAHFGVGMMVLGIVGTTAWQSEKVLVVKPGATVDIAGFTLKFLGVGPSQGPNYREQVGIFDVTSNGQAVTTLHPAKRVYDQPPVPTTEAGIHNAWGGDLYVVLGDAQKDGGYTVRLYFNPLVRLIWLGAIVMVLGGMLSLSDRRLRVGAPRRARPSATVVAAE